MTTGRINQVTTFRSAFAAIVYSRVTSTRFRDAEFIITFRVQDPSAARTVGTKLGLVERRTRKWHHLISHSRTSQVRSPFPRHGKTKGSPTYDEDYRRPTTDVAEPRVASCIRFDHRRAIHLLQHRSSTSHKDGIRL